MKKRKVKIIIDGQEIFSGEVYEKDLSYSAVNDLEDVSVVGNFLSQKVSRGINFSLSGYIRNEDYKIDMEEALKNLERSR